MIQYILYMPFPGCHRSSLLQLAPPCCAVTRIWKFLQHVLGYQIKQRWLFWSLSFALTWWNWHIKNPLKSARCSLLTSDRTSAQAIKIFMDYFVALLPAANLFTERLNPRVTGWNFTWSFIIINFNAFQLVSIISFIISSWVNSMLIRNNFPKLQIIILIKFVNLT